MTSSTVGDDDGIKQHKGKFLYCAGFFMYCVKKEIFFSRYEKNESIREKLTVMMMTAVMLLLYYGR